MEMESDFLKHRNIPMELFITLKLKEKSCQALEWINKDERIFKLYWGSKNCPDASAIKKLCEDWAENRNVERGSLSLSELKKRFLNTFTKSPEFTEQDDLKISNLQTGNYRVFKCNTQEEAEAKRKKNKLKKHKKANKTITSTLCQLPTESNVSDELQGNILDDILSHQNYDSDETNASEQQEMLKELSDSLNEAPEIDMDETLNSVVDTELYQDISADNLINLQVTLEQQSTYEADRKLLESFDLSFDDLPVFDVTLRYEKENVERGKLNFSGGFRFQGANFMRQQAVETIKAYCKKEELNFETQTFPPYCGDNRHIPGILDNTDLGIVLKFESDLKLYALRLCQSKVFFNSFDQSGDEFIKLERNKPVVLFSYVDYITKCIQFIERSPNTKPELPECQIILSVGTRPPTLRSRTLISLILEPVVSQGIANKFGQNETSCFFSSENSLDKLVEVFSQVSVSSTQQC